MRPFKVDEMGNIGGGGCDRLDYWTGVVGSFTLGAAAFGAFPVAVGGMVVTGVLGAASLGCNGVYVYGNR